jgi:MFS family permease
LYVVQGLDASPVVLGIIALISSSTATVLRIPFGYFSDKFGRKWTSTIGLAAELIGCIVLFLSRNVEMVILARAIHGISFASFRIASLTSVEDMAKLKSSGVLLGFFTSFEYVGLIFGPIMGGYIAYLYGYASVFLLCSAVSLIALLFLGLKMKETLTKRDLTDKGAQERTQKEAKDGLRDLFRFPGVNMQVIIILYSILFALHFGPGVAGGYVPVYAYEHYNLNVAEIGYVTAIPSIILVLGSIPTAKLGDKFGNRPLVALGAILWGFSYAVFGLGSGTEHLFAYYVMNGIGSPFAYVSFRALEAETVPTKMRARILAIFRSITEGMATGVGPLLGGFIWVTYGSAIVFTLSSWILLIGAFVFVTCSFFTAQRLSPLPCVKAKE